MPETQKATTYKMQIIKREVPIQVPSFEWIPTKKKRPSQRLFANIVTAAAILLCVTVVNASNHEKVQSVFQTIQSSVNLNLDEALGKLSFVSNLLPESALVFWNDSASTTITAPVEGDIIHVFTSAEPYISMKSAVSQVRCVQDGEVMSIAHGNDDETIVRIRHNDNLESIYGNLKTVWVSEGEGVFQEDLIGEVLEGKELVFELRRDGRSIDPTYSMVK